MRILNVVAERSAPREKPLGVEEDFELGVGEEFKPVDVPSGGDSRMMETGVPDMSVSELEVDSVEAFDEAVEDTVFEGLELEN